MLTVPVSTAAETPPSLFQPRILLLASYCAAGAKMQRNRPKILCLDDQPESLRLRKTFLELFGCEVVAVEDGYRCLDAAGREDFDLALLDYHLAGNENGEKVARELRRRFPQIPLIMLTGDPRIPSSVKDCVDALLIKGTGSPRELLDTIERLIPNCSLKPRREPISRAALSDTARQRSGNVG